MGWKAFLKGLASVRTVVRAGLVGAGGYLLAHPEIVAAAYPPAAPFVGPAMMAAGVLIRSSKGGATPTPEEISAMVNATLAQVHQSASEPVTPASMRP